MKTAIKLVGVLVALSVMTGVAGGAVALALAVGVRQPRPYERPLAGSGER